MRKQARRERAQRKAFETAEAKTHRTALKAHLNEIEKENDELAEYYMKHGRENWYRMKQAGFDFSDDYAVLEVIAGCVRDPKFEFITIVFDGAAPGIEKDTPLFCIIKAPSNPDTEKGTTLPVGKWTQFCTFYTEIRRPRMSCGRP